MDGREGSSSSRVWGVIDVVADDDDGGDARCGNASLKEASVCCGVVGGIEGVGSERMGIGVGVGW